MRFFDTLVVVQDTEAVLLKLQARSSPRPLEPPNFEARPNSDDHQDPELQQTGLCDTFETPFF